MRRERHTANGDERACSHVYAKQRVLLAVVWVVHALPSRNRGEEATLLFVFEHDDGARPLCSSSKSLEICRDGE